MISFFARHPTAANLLMFVMICSGLLSLGGLRRETLPDSRPVEVEIAIAFPGATAEDVEETIVRRLEDALDGVQSLKEMRGVAVQSLGKVTVKMLDNGDYNSFRNEIDNAVSSIDELPDDAELPTIKRLHTRQRVMEILVAGPMNAVSLKAYCETLRNELIASPVVSEVEIDGFSDHLLRVNVSREAMLRYGLSTNQVSTVIARQSLDLPAGKIESSKTVLVRVQESRKTQQSLEELVIAGAPGGAEVRLGDIATVSDEFEIAEDRVSVDGRRGAVLKIMKATTEDTLAVSDAVLATLETERLRNPQVTLEVINDKSKLVKDRIRLLVKNGVQGCILVFLTLWLFFNARLSFWVVLSLPVSFLAAFALVPGAGLTVNMITMVGLLMAIGLLMDDGIVIAENIARHRHNGEPAMTAAINGVKEVSSGVVSSFLTTCCVLGPLIFLSGEIGKILQVLPMMLLLVLATSLIEAFLILPAHLAHSLAHDHSVENRSAIRVKLDRLIDVSRDTVAACVRWTVRWRYPTLGLTIMVFLITVGLLAGGLVRGQVFPELEGDTIVARVLMPPGTPLARTTEVVAEIERALEETNEAFRPRQPGQRDLVQSTFARFNYNIDAAETGAHVATVQADLLSNEIRDGWISEVIRAWRKNLGPVPDAVKITMDEPTLGPQGRDIQIQLSGVDLESLDRISAELQDHLQTFDGVYNINDDLRRGETELLVNLSPGAVGLNVSSFDLARQLRGSFQGLLSDQIQVGDEAYDVEVRFADADRSSISDLEDYLVSLPSGTTVPLSEVARLTRRRGWSRIAHTDGVRVVNVMARVDALRSNSMAVLGKLREEKLAELQEKHNGLKYQFKGSAENGKETGSSMAITALIGCIGVFVILSFQFRSYIEPAIVMVAIPFAFVGVVWGHLFFGLDLSLPSIMGYASLAGIVVNDSILLVLFVKARRSDGVPPAEAAVEASRIRFRAVMITSLTTIAGLLPLLTENSLQAQLLIPIAVSICFGLMASTLLVLLVIPALYVLLCDFGLTGESLHAESQHA